MGLDSEGMSPHEVILMSVNTRYIFGAFMIIAGYLVCDDYHIRNGNDLKEELQRI